MSDLSDVTETGQTESEIVGYIESFTADSVIGWAWRPGSSERLEVQLLRDEQLLALSTADISRDDLAHNGIGDGKHSFTLNIPEAFRSRGSELQIKAVQADGKSSRLTALQGKPVVPAGNATIQRGIEMLVNSQRLLHRNLQAALLREGPSAAISLAEVSAAQLRLQESIEAIELFVVRLDSILDTKNEDRIPRSTPRYIPLVVSMSVLAVFGSCAALWRVMITG